MNQIYNVKLKNLRIDQNLTIKPSQIKQSDWNLNHIKKN